MLYCIRVYVYASMKCKSWQKTPMMTIRSNEKKVSSINPINFDIKAKEVDGKK